MEALKVAREYQNKLLQDYEKKYRDMLKERGMEFINPNREAFRKLALTEFPQAFKGIWAEDLFKRIWKVE